MYNSSQSLFGNIGAVAFISGDHPPVSCQGCDPSVVGSATQQRELCVRVGGVEVKGILYWLADDQRAPSGGHKYNLIDVVGVVFSRDLNNGLIIKQIQLMCNGSCLTNPCRPNVTIAQLDTSNVSVGNLPDSDCCDPSLSVCGERSATTNSNSTGEGVVRQGSVSQAASAEHSKNQEGKHSVM